MDRKTGFRRRPLTGLLVLALAALAAGGCALGPPLGGPPEVRGPRTAEPAGGKQRPAGGKRPAAHVVRKGDTLSAIAFQYKLDYRSIARWNRIPDPYVIHPGQRISLQGPPAPAPPRASAKAKTKTKGAGSGGSPTPSAAAPVSARGWTWPAKGGLLRGYGKGERGGIDIGGRRGQPVVAAKGGRVVYAGSGLTGYGRLVIVKHGERLLTAYAHNERLLVKEGQTVRGGQKIAEMGSTGADRVMLHFEVRRDGKPLNPMKYLPRRG